MEAWVMVPAGSLRPAPAAIGSLPRVFDDSRSGQRPAPFSFPLLTAFARRRGRGNGWKGARAEPAEGKTEPQRLTVVTFAYGSNPSKELSTSPPGSRSALGRR